MKILILQPWISYRGAETVSLLEANAFGKRNASIMALYVDWKRISPRYKNVSFILPPKLLQKIFARSKITVYLFGTQTLLIMLAISFRKFDLLNPHNLPTSWICALLKPFTRKKIVWTVHGIPQKAESTSLGEKFLWLLGTSWIDIWAVSRMDALVAVSQKVAKGIKKRYHREAIILTPLIDIDFNKRRSFPAAHGKRVFLHISYLHPAKNVMLSLHAFEKVLSKISNALLIIIGEGPQKNELVAYVNSKNLSKNVQFTGFIPHEKLGGYFAIATAVLQPFYQTEGLPLTTLEAIAFGKQVIIARGSGAEELGQGLVVNPTISDFASAMIKSLTIQAKSAYIFSSEKKYVQTFEKLLQEYSR